jgi:hypothetical protein
MAHELARAFQQANGIGYLRAAKEPDIDVSFEGIDIGECRISDTRGRMAIMQQLSNIVSAVAHDLKPALRDRSQFTRMLMHPNVDRWISPDRTWEKKKLAHGDFISTLDPTAGAKSLLAWIKVGFSLPSADRSFE